MRYFLGRVLQVTGLLVTLVAATAFFGTSSTIAMLRMMLIGVLLFIPGWWLARPGCPRRGLAFRDRESLDRRGRVSTSSAGLRERGRAFASG